MSDVEKVEFGDQVFDLAANGFILGESGGTIVFVRGDMPLNEIEFILQNNPKITRIGSTGDPKAIRSDLVYAGKMTNQSGYVVNTKQVMIGENEYMEVDVKADVIIADFRKPDLNEQLAAAQIRLDITDARLSYMSMMSGIEMEGLIL